MNLGHTLLNVSKDPKQSMEDYLWSIKHITNSLVSIHTHVLDTDLVQLTLNGLDEDYHTLVMTFLMASIYAPLTIFVPI